MGPSAIIGFGFQRGFQLLEGMCADADLDIRSSDSAEIGGDEVLLAEMHEVRAEVDRLAPIVVDDELAAMHRAESDCSLDLTLHDAMGFVFDAELNQLDTAREQPGKPVGVGDDGVEGIEADQGGARPGSIRTRDRS